MLLKVMLIGVIKLMIATESLRQLGICDAQDIHAGGIAALIAGPVRRDPRVLGGLCDMIRDSRSLFLFFLVVATPSTAKGSNECKVLSRIVSFFDSAEKP